MPGWLLVSLLVAAQVLIGTMDHFAGKGASFFVFYAAPIAGITWLVGRRAGLWLAVISGLIWLAANHGNMAFSSAWSVGWVALGRIAYFVFIALGTSAFRNKADADAAKIQMLNEMRHLELELVNVREREQQRFGQDLHDGLCQQLAALSCAVEALADDLRQRNAPEADDAAHIGSQLQRSVAETRSMASGMTSLSVERGGIVKALEMLVQMTNRLGNVPVILKADPSLQIDDAEQATHLYRIAQEAISNAVRHSGAGQVSVTFGREGNCRVLRVEDDGRGFVEQVIAQTKTGIGLQTMRYRAHAIGAECAITSRDGGGTIVCCTLRQSPAFS